jgi:predicted nucleic acid-binding protein
MRQFVLDANAVIRYVTGGPGAERVSSLFAQQQRGEAQLAMSAVNRGEVFYQIARRAGIQGATQSLRTLARSVESVPVVEEHADGAAALKFKYKLGFADCFAADLAMRRGATLVTADPEFAKLGKQLRVLALPRHKP